MTKITTFLNQIPGWMQPIGYALAIAMFCFSGLLMMTGQEGSAKAKKWVAYICMGIGILFLAADIATSLRSAAGG
jgi:type IV secretory pathway VirB2 component (pilin)